VVAVAATASIACNHTRTSPCPRPEPPFRVELTAVDGTLPADTNLVVTYNGSNGESFDLVHKGASNVDVCCRASNSVIVEGPLPEVTCGASKSDIDAGDGGATVAILCQLWTGGNAQIDVTGQGYAPLEDDLLGQLLGDGCGSQTSDVREVLERPEAGTGN
jgi:hypothetical protein